MATMARSTRFLFFLLVLAGLTLSIHINSQRVMFTDELLFEEVSYRMVQTGNFLTPIIDDKPWLEKPPLYFWMTAPLFRAADWISSKNLFDWSQNLTPDRTFIYPWIRRFWTKFLAVIVLIYVYRISKELAGVRQGLIAFGLLLATPLFVFTSFSASLDVAGSAFITIAFFYYLRYLRQGRGYYLFWGSVAIDASVMTRSFLGLTPLAVIVLHQLFFVRRRIPVKHILASVVTIAAFVLPWHWYAYVQYRQDFLNTYLGFNSIGHVVEVPEGYTPTSAWYYLALLLTQNPWFYFAIITVFGWAPARRNYPPELSLIFLWFLVPILVLSAAATRHQWYMIQILPSVSVLASFIVDRLSRYLGMVGEIFALAFVFAPFLAVAAFGYRRAPVVEAVYAVLPYISENQPLFTLNQSYLPQTLLFRPRPVQIINFDQLAVAAETSSPFYVFIADKDLEMARRIVVHLERLGSFSPGGVFYVP